ncbi:MAG TPA: alpha/beta hydrolase [Alphaproteobacteria bacterium]
MQAAVYGPYSQEALDDQYNTRLTAPDFAQIFERWARDSAKARQAGAATLDVAFGSSADETLDVFHAKATGAPIQIFFHGGYWRSMHKNDFAFLAPPFSAAGAVAVVPNYSLCPGVTMDTLIEQCRRAVDWTYKNARRIGGDPDRIHISGHSAGGHIVAMMLATDWVARGLPAEPIRGACAISGLYDLEPIRLSFLNVDVRLTPEMALRNSPIEIMRKKAPPTILALGALESAEFHRQTARYDAVLRANGTPVEVMDEAGLHHFSILDAFCDRRQALGRAVLRQMGLE